MNRVYIDLDGVMVNFFWKLNKMFLFDSWDRLDNQTWLDDALYTCGATTMTKKGDIVVNIDFMQDSGKKFLYHLENVFDKKIFDAIYSLEDPYEFWLNMDPLPNIDINRVWNVLIEQFGVDNCYILSAATRNHREECIRGKKDWVRKYIPQVKEENILILNGLHEKKKYAHSYMDILFDDFLFIIEDWNRAGGTAVAVPYNYKTDDFVSDILNVRIATELMSISDKYAKKELHDQLHIVQ